MSTTHDETGIQRIPVATPATSPPPMQAPIEVVPLPEATLVPTVVATRKAPAYQGAAENTVVVLAGWVARIVVGVFMISNVFPLSFITAIAAFGWFQRRMQAIALRGWWRESPRRLEGTFAHFCDSLGANAPVERPRWFWRERIGQTLAKSTGFRSLIVLLTLPIHSLWLNFKTGFAGLLTTFLLTSWGCFIMLFSWYFGWLNSFHKGYEDAFFGPLSGLLGSFLLILALIYVPMAQAHQATAGEIAAFFQFRVVIRLILTRLTAYVMLSGGLALAALIFTFPRFATLAQAFPPNDEDFSPYEAYWLLEAYWLACSVPFFIALLILRTMAALIYRSAMLKAVRAGTILTGELPPRLALWFEKLEIVPQAQLPQNVIVAALKTTISLKYRALMFGIQFGIWLLFVMWFYTSYFLVFSEYRGMLNHPVVQIPCIDWTPWHLLRGEEE